jgi:hypothetical protein
MAATWEMPCNVVGWDDVSENSQTLPKRQLWTFTSCEEANSRLVAKKVGSLPSLACHWLLSYHISRSTEGSRDGGPGQGTRQDLASPVTLAVTL